MTISLDIDKDSLLSRFSGIHYKYVVLHGNGKCTWEFVPRRVSPNNRLLSLPRDHIQQLTGMYLRYIAHFWVDNKVGL